MPEFEKMSLSEVTKRLKSWGFKSMSVGKARIVAEQTWKYIHYQEWSEFLDEYPSTFPTDVSELEDSGDSTSYNQLSF